MNNLDSYHKRRPEIKTGDAIQWRSESLIGRIIRWRTGSDVNHTSMVIRFPSYSLSRVFVIEALEHGLVLRSLSERLKKHIGRAYHLPLVPGFMLQRRRIGRLALDFIGSAIEYDYEGCIFGNMFGRAKKDPDKLFCSEFWYVAIENIVDITGDETLRNLIHESNEYLSGRAPTPGDLRHLPITATRRVRIL